MVRYSDVIKKGNTRRESGEKDLMDHEKTNDSPRFSILKESGIPSDLSPMPAQKDTEDVKKLHSTIVDYLVEVQGRVKNDDQFDIIQAIDIINHIINTPGLIERFYQSTALSDDRGNKENYLILHLINALIYAIKLGAGLNYSRDELLELGLAAIFYDIGFFKIQESVIEKKGKLTTAEINTIRSHTEIGKNLLSQFQTEHPMLARVALEHHEREDGSGYPKGLKKDEICEYAKITGLADTFDAMIRNRPYRKALAQHFSVKELVSSKNSMFSSRVIKVFLEEIGIFPVGSYVRLNNMEIARVVGNSKIHPLKPTVKLVINGQGGDVPGETIITLERHPLLYVTAAVDREDLPTEQVI
jgi:HD-GYP domain-containing protein (c-di-GMP phosphodiesterase class II)